MKKKAKDMTNEELYRADLIKREKRARFRKRVTIIGAIIIAILIIGAIICIREIIKGAQLTTIT